MKSIKHFFLIAAAIISLSFTDVNAQASSAVAARQAKPAKSLEQQIFKKIMGLPNYGLFDHITYQVNGGTVLLSGNVYSLGTRKSAERVVRRIAGVEQVVNNIRELPPSSFDDAIRQRIVNEFVNAPGVYRYIYGVNPPVRIIVNNGRVALEGYVRDRGTARYMNILANRVPGTFRVTNNLIVENEIDS